MYTISGLPMKITQKCLILICAVLFIAAFSVIICHNPESGAADNDCAICFASQVASSGTSLFPPINPVFADYCFMAEKTPLVLPLAPRTAIDFRGPPERSSAFFTDDRNSRIA